MLPFSVEPSNLETEQPEDRDLEMESQKERESTSSDHHQQNATPTSSRFESGPDSTKKGSKGKGKNTESSLGERRTEAEKRRKQSKDWESPNRRNSNGSMSIDAQNVDDQPQSSESRIRPSQSPSFPRRRSAQSFGNNSSRQEENYYHSGDEEPNVMTSNTSSTRGTKQKSNQNSQINAVFVKDFETGEVGLDGNGRTDTKVPDQDPKSSHFFSFKKHPNKLKAIPLERTTSITFNDFVKVGGGGSTSRSGVNTSLQSPYVTSPNSRFPRSESFTTDDDNTSDFGTSTDDGESDAFTVASEDEVQPPRKPFTPILNLWRRFRPLERSRTPDGDNELILYRRTPLISGSFAPFSIMLEIPAFTSKWYVTSDGFSYRPNPIILDVGLAISFTAAVCANAFIIFRFLEIMKPRRSTFLAILMFIIHDLINIVALITFGVVHAVDDGFTYSQAYWMTTASTVASLIATFSLFFDYFNTKNFKDSGSGLTSKQKELIIIIMLLLFYLSIGALIFSLLIPDLSFEYSLYFILTIASTVGFGNVTPTTVGSRIFFILYTPIGIVLLALTVTTARSSILEEFEQNYIKRRERFRQRHQEKVQQRREQRRIKRTLRRAIVSGGRTAISSIVPFVSQHPTQLSEKSSEGGVGGKEHSTKSWSLKGAWASFKGGRIRLEDTSSRSRTGGDIMMSDYKSNPMPSSSRSSPSSLERLQKDQDEDREKAEHLSENVEHLPVSLGQDRITTSSTSPSVALHQSESPSQSADQSHQASSNEDEFQDEVARMEANLKAQRADLEREWNDYSKSVIASEKAAFWAKLVVSWSLFLLFWLVGSAVFSATEGWSFFTAFYFCFVTFSSIGFGDYVVESKGGLAFFIIWVLFGIGIMTILLSVIGESFGSNFKLVLTRSSTKRASRRVARRAARLQQAEARRVDSETGTDGGGLDEGENHQQERNDQEQEGSVSRNPMIPQEQDQLPDLEKGDLDQNLDSRLEESSMKRSDSPTPSTAASSSAPVKGKSLLRRDPLTFTRESLSRSRTLDSKATSPPHPRFRNNSLLSSPTASTSKFNSTSVNSSSSPLVASRPEAAATPEDIPLHLARSARDFHHEATRFMESQKETLVKLVGTVPAIKEILPLRFGGSASHSTPTLSHQLGDEDVERVQKLRSQREEVRKTIKEVQDPETVAVSEQVFALINLEEQLHHLLSNASAMRDIILSQQKEISSLRSQTKGSLVEDSDNLD